VARFEPAQPEPSAYPRWVPGPLAGALARLGRGGSSDRRKGPLSRVPRALLAAVVAVVLVAGLVVAQEVAAAGEVRRGVRVGGVELSGLTRVAATDRLRAAAGTLQASPLTLKAGAASLALPRSKAGVELDVEASVAAAMEVGRGGPSTPTVSRAGSAASTCPGRPGWRRPGWTSS
jgi:hypothetical protein